MTETYGQLEQLWLQAGGNPQVASQAAAIALAESSGNPNSLNLTDNNGTQTSWGLWQISNGTHSQPGPNPLNPLSNAEMAVAKYVGAGNQFTPWGTYDSGAYLRYLHGGVAPAGGGNVSSAGGSPAGSTASPGISLLKIPVIGGVSISKETLVRGTLLIMGLVISYFGIKTLFTDKSLSENVSETASNIKDKTKQAGELLA